MRRVQSVLREIREDLTERALLGADLEQVKVRQAPHWLCEVWPDETKAMTLGTTILFRPEVDIDWSDAQIASLVAHELTHVRQFRRMGVATFFIRYVSDYLRGRTAGLSHFDAYEAIALEEEARNVVQVYRDGVE